MTMPDPSRLRPSDATVRPSEWMTVLICTTGTGAGRAPPCRRPWRPAPRARRPGKAGATRGAEWSQTEGRCACATAPHAQRRRRPQDRGLAEQMLGRDLQRPAEAFRQEQALHPAAEGHATKRSINHGAKPLAQRLSDRRPAAFRQLKRTYLRSPLSISSQRIVTLPAGAAKAPYFTALVPSSNSAKRDSAPRPGAASGSRRPCRCWCRPRDEGRELRADKVADGRAGPVLRTSTSCERASPCSRPMKRPSEILVAGAVLHGLARHRLDHRQQVFRAVRELRA